MSLREIGLQEAELSELSVTLRNAGLAGAGGAGFPTYAKWQQVDDVDALLVNHQESEPNYFMDKWLGAAETETLAGLFEALLDEVFDVIVVGAKEKDRDRWMREFERLTDATVYRPDDLPVDEDEESGVVFAYTEDRYEFGMESVLLRMVADTVIGNDLPVDHGWIVQNTETLYRAYHALVDGDPMTRKFVVVDGDVPNHRLLDVPVGTPAAALLEAAGRVPSEIRDHEVLLDGGPGWCFEVEQSADEFGIRKRTNCVLALPEREVEGNLLGDERVNVLSEREWENRAMESEPTARLDPNRVRIPLITNPSFEGVVERARPLVEVGDDVDEGEMIARPTGDGFSVPHHASIPGTVTEVSDSHVTIERDWNRGLAGESASHTEKRIFWTWCQECGEYVTEPKTAGTPDPTRYVCPDCR